MIKVINKIKTYDEIREIEKEAKEIQKNYRIVSISVFFALLLFAIAGTVFMCKLHFFVEAIVFDAIYTVMLSAIAVLYLSKISKGNYWHELAPATYKFYRACSYSLEGKPHELRYKINKKNNKAKLYSKDHFIIPIGVFEIHECTSDDDSVIFDLKTMTCQI